MTTATETPEKAKLELTADEARRFSVLASLGTTAALAALEWLAEEIPTREAAITQAKMRVELAEDTLELREAELIDAGIEGKNEGERKAKLTQGKAEDAVYQERLTAKREALTAVHDAERQAQAARHKERYWHAFVALRTAQATYLAGN